VETIDDYLDRLASSEPVPGGGSAAALTAQLAAALVAMVGRIVAAPIEGLVDRADRLRGALGDARRRDEKAYAAVIAAQERPKRDEGERLSRRVALEAALREAAQSPLDAAGLALEVLRLADRLIESPRGALASDVGCAAELGYAAIAACAFNVRINHFYMRDQAAIRDQSARLESIERDAQQIRDRVRAAL
jgi:formiminotetrahydrofolate cyclodeaminase